MSDQLLLIFNTSALVLVALLVVEKLLRRRWATSDQRSLLIIYGSVLLLALAGMTRRLAAPDWVIDNAVGSAWVAITVAFAYRGYLLTHPRD